MTTSDNNNKSTPIQVWGPLLIALAIGLGMVVGMQMGHVKVIQLKGDSPSTKIEIGRVEEVLRFVESHYVDSVRQEELKQNAINGMLKGLDPHSKYLTPEMLSLVNRDMYNVYIGLGILPKYIEDSIYVSFVFKDSPAARQGIQVGDKLIEINGAPVAEDLSSLEASISSSSSRDTIWLTLSRKGLTQKVALVKASIALDEIPGHFMIDDSIGLIRIERFGSETYRHFMQALEGLTQEGCKDLIIDVRGNAGGFLNETIKIISQLFAERDLPIAWAEGIHAPKQVFRTKGRPFFNLDDIVVLVDEQSASASEILAGALQDLSRAVIVGRRTFGKGLVQEQYELPDGYALRLTTARYYLPSGRSIQRDYSHGNTAYRDQWYERLNTGELLSRDSVHLPDTTKYYTRLGKVVYSKSGILPDVFIPYSSFELEEGWSDFINEIDDDILRHYSELSEKYVDVISGDTLSLNKGKKGVSTIKQTDRICNEILSRVCSQTPAWNRLLQAPDSMRRLSTICDYIHSDLLSATGDKNAYYKYLDVRDSAVTHAIDILRNNKADSILKSSSNAEKVYSRMISN